MTEPTNANHYSPDRLKIEQAALRKYAAIQKAAEDKIGCQAIYVDMAGDWEAALILDELIFFTLPRDGKISALRVWKEGCLWLAVQRSEWWKRKRLTPRQVDGAVKKLLSKSLIFTMVAKFKGQNTVHMRLNIPEFFRLYQVLLEADTTSDGLDRIQNFGELYEIVNFSGLPNGDLQNGKSPNGDTKSPNGDTKSPNGNFLTTLTQPSQPYERLGRTDFEIIVHELETLCGGLASNTADLIQTWLEKHTLEWILKAIEEARAHGAKSPKYVDRVLVGWEANGYPQTRDEQVRSAKKAPTKAAAKAQAAFDSLKALSQEYAQNGE